MLRTVGKSQAKWNTICESTFTVYCTWLQVKFLLPPCLLAILWRGVVTLWIHTWRANEQGMIYIIYHISMQWWTKEQLDGCWGRGSHVASMLLRTFSRFNSRLIMTNTARDSTNKKVRFPGPPGLANKRVYHCLHVKVTWNLSLFNPGKFS